MLTVRETFEVDTISYLTDPLSAQLAEPLDGEPLPRFPAIGSVTWMLFPRSIDAIQLDIFVADTHP